MRTRFLIPVLILSLALLAPGCASKYGDQITKVNYYPQCYQPVSDLRADENAVAKSTATGAIGGALIGAAIGGLASGDWKGALAGAAVGGAGGAVAGHAYGKHKQQQRDAAYIAHYAQMLDEDTASMNRTTAAARVATNCYNTEFKRLVADYKAKRVTKEELRTRYEEIRSGLQEISYILTERYDQMQQKDAEYQAALASDYTAAPSVTPKKASAKKKQSIAYKSSARKQAAQDMADQKNEITKSTESQDLLVSAIMEGSYI